MPKSPWPRARFSLSPLVRALFVAVAATVAIPALAAPEHEEVDRLMQAGKLDEAMSRADSYLKERPRDPQMRFLKGVIQLDTGKRAEAIAAFTQLTQDAPELPEPFNNLAVIYASQNQFDKARAALESAIRTNPSYATAQENLGDVYARLASQAYSKALQLDQNNTAVQPKLAVIRTLFTGDTPGATASAAAPGARSKTVAAVTPAPEPVARPTAPPPAPVAPPPAPAPAPVAKAPPAPAPAPAPAVVAVAPAPAPAPAPKAAPAPAPAPAPVAKAVEPPAAAPAAANAEIESAVRAWAAAWAGQDMDRYLAAYGENFKPTGNQSRKAWEEERRARIVGKSNISVNLDGLTIKADGNSATAKFRQIYRADNLNISSRKTLEFERNGSHWHIRKESVGG